MRILFKKLPTDAQIKNPVFKQTLFAIDQVFLSILSALLFLSFVLSVFSPIPLILLFLRKSRGIGFLVTGLNVVIIALVSSRLNLIAYCIYVVTLSVVFSECVKRKLSLQRSIFLTLVGMALAAISLNVFCETLVHWSPYHDLRSEVSKAFDLMPSYFGSSDSPKTASELAEFGEIKDKLISGLPSALAVMSLVTIWLNLLFLIQVNPLKVREKTGFDLNVLKEWKTPEYLVWPSIGVGFGLLLGSGAVLNWAQNLFYFLALVYSLQGLAIVSFILSKWKMRGIWRTFSYLVFVVYMKDLLLFIGFFDLWFDFRSKFRQL